MEGGNGCFNNGGKVEIHTWKRWGRGLRQKVHKFKASLNCIERPSQKFPSKKINFKMDFHFS